MKIYSLFGIFLTVVYCTITVAAEMTRSTAIQLALVLLSPASRLADIPPVLLLDSLQDGAANALNFDVGEMIGPSLPDVEYGQRNPRFFRLQRETIPRVHEQTCSQD